MNHRTITTAAATAWLVLITTTQAEIRVLPAKVQLGHDGATQRLATFQYDDQTVGGSVGSVRYETSDPNVVIVSASTVRAVGDGEAIITATDATGNVATATVSVRGTGTQHRWSFRNDVQSILARQGCNMGACHGALAGKGGFRLSLRGYDWDADYHAITREALGRRVELGDPGRSLLLAKPSGAIAHKGGLRLDAQSRDYQIIADWISGGIDPPTDADAKLTGIEVLPAEATVRPGDEMQLLVSAHYDNGKVVDVTHWAQFTATDSSVADVDEDGQVAVAGSGQAAVSVWFGSKIALTRLTVPYDNAVAQSVYDTAPRRNFIDEMNLRQLQRLRLQPSPRCDDETFLRRAAIDTVGRLPSSPERQGYYQSDPKVRRDWLIERLLADEDFVNYWTYKWSDVLLINGNRLRPAAVKTYYDWLRDAVAKNQPWDELVHEILTSTGGSLENGATNFFAVNQSPEDMTENACQAFMGLSIGCAKCHNHPLEKWTNNQYYAMANLFARVRGKGWGGDGRNGDGRRELYVMTQGDLIQPGRGRPQPPAALDQPPIDFDDPSDRRAVLAGWMTDGGNPYFARSITNRVWKNFFGRGLVEQVDDLRQSNPASNEPLLAAAAQHLIDNAFDLKTLMRTILQSETYQRSSQPTDGNRGESQFHARYYPRRMMAEVLLDSIDQVLGTSTSFTQVAFPGADKQKTDFYEAGTRAIELYDSAVDSYFLTTFGRNPREITCECERDDEPSMVQVLHLSNGETLNPKLTAQNSFAARAIESGWDNATILDRLFDLALCRAPTPNERRSLLDLMDSYDDRDEAIIDATWSVLTSVEFVFNH